MSGHSKSVRSVSWSPDGTKLASGSDDKTVRIWEVATGKELSQLNVDAGTWGVRSVSFSPKGDMVAAGCYNGKIYFVDPTAGEIKSSLSVDSTVWSVAFSADGTGTTLAAGLGSPSMSVLILDAQSGEIKSSLRAHKYQVDAVAWSPCGRWLASGGCDKMVYVYDAKTFQVKSSLKVDGEVSSVAFSIDGSMIAAAFNVYDDDEDFQNGGVQIFSKEGSTGNFVCQSTLKGHCKDNEECICEFESWGELKTRRAECPVRGHTDVVRSVCFSSDGKQLTSGSDDSTVRNWDP